MQYQVPQFIEVEDKIFGPFTFKQFVYLAGGAGLAFVIWSFVRPRFLSLLLIGPVIAFALALAFYKVNGKPFIFVAESAVRYFFAKKLYIWKKVEPKTPTKKQKEEQEMKSVEQLYVPKISDSKLKDLSWSLDVHKKIK